MARVLLTKKKKKKDHVKAHYVLVLVFLTKQLH